MINLSINGTEVDDIIVKCDRNKDGNIDFEEFVKFIVDEWLFIVLSDTINLIILQVINLFFISYRFLV